MKFSKLHRNLKIRFFELLISNLLGNMITPFMTIYFASRFGGALAGTLLAVNIILGIVAGFFGGPLADRFGRRKMLIIAEFLRLTSFMVMAIANSPWFDSAVLTFMMCSLQAIFWGIAGPATEAMTVDCSDDETRPLIYSMSYWAWNISVLIGGAVGGYLFEEYHFEIFLAAAFMSIISLLLLVFFIEELYQIPNTVKQDDKWINPFKGFSAYKSVLTNTWFLFFCIASVLNGSIENIANYFTGIRLDREMINGTQMYGTLLSANALVVVIFGLMVPFIIKRFKQRNTLFFGIVLYAIGYSIVVFSNQPYLLITAMAVATLGEIIWIPVTQTLMAKIIPDDARSTYLGFYGMTHRLRHLIGTLFITIGYYIGSIGVSIFVLCFALSSIFMYNILWRRHANSLDTKSEKITTVTT